MKHQINSVLDLLQERWVIDILIFLDLADTRAVPITLSCLYDETTKNPRVPEKLAAMEEFGLIRRTDPGVRDGIRYPNFRSTYVEITGLGSAVSEYLLEIKYKVEGMA